MNQENKNQPSQLKPSKQKKNILLIGSPKLVSNEKIIHSEPLPKIFLQEVFIRTNVFFNFFFLR